MTLHPDDEVTPISTIHPHPNSQPAVSGALLDQCFAFTSPFEGNFNHMYLDTEGNVTVGVGCLLSSPREAAKLPFIPSQEVVGDFAAVASKPAGHLAGWYKQYTHSVLPSAAIRGEFDKRCLGVIAWLRRTAPGFDSFPQPAQIALVDMVFNLGAGKYATDYVHLKQAVFARDWRECAAQCHRRGIQEPRNTATASLFQRAFVETHGAP